MVKIDTVTAYGPTNRLRKKERDKGNATFSVAASSPDNLESSYVASPQSAGEIASLASLMQIQEVGERDANTRQATLAGESILKSLEKLQNEILMGAISKRSLEHIVSMTNALPSQIINPDLNQIIAEIKQRAMIELAKIEMSTPSLQRP